VRLLGLNVSGGLIGSAVAGVLVALVIFASRQVVKAAVLMLKVVKVITDFQAQWDEASDLAGDLARNTRDLLHVRDDLDHIAGLLGVPDPGDEQTPLIAYLHDQLHDFRNLITKDQMAGQLMAELVLRLGRLTERLEKAPGQ
jgi:hypothetical protein